MSSDTLLDIVDYFLGMINILKPSCYFTYHWGLTLKNITWCSHYVYVLCIKLRTNIDLYLLQH